MARKYRPRNFHEVVGQAQVVQTLQNALRKGRYAHAYIFSGPRGTGKTTMARILARALNCVKGPTPNPCGECSPCRQILQGNFLDMLEIDAASNRGIEEIRNLRENVRFSPAEGKFRVYIIDEIHMLTVPAFNALLKTLEEPPPHAIFIGATTEIEQVPRTVLSRVQRFNFRLVPRNEIAGYLQKIAEAENIAIEPEAVDLLAGRANGSLRDGVGLLDQMSAFCEGKITTEEVKTALGVIDQDAFFRAEACVSGKSVKAVFELVDDLSLVGTDPAEFIRGLAEHFRNLLLVKSTGSAELIEGTELFRRKMLDSAEKFSELDLTRLMKMAYEAANDLKKSTTPMLGLELRLLTMLKLHDAPELSELLKGLKASSSVITASPPSPPTPTASTPPNMFAEKEEKPEEVFPSVADDTLPMMECNIEAEEPAEDIPFGLKRIQDFWDAICEELKKVNHGLGALLKDAKLEGLKGNSLEIAMLDKFNYNRIKPSKSLLENAIKTVTGVALSVKIILREGKDFPATVKNNQHRGAKELLNDLVKEDANLKDLVEKFGGEAI
jgi:DNA polymerase-3 subunit gamma/tau